MKFLPQEWYVRIYYEYYTGKKLDLENPVEFNEKIQWLKVYYRPEILTQLVDKYAVREYVKEKIGEEYLNTLLKVYDRAGDVDFSTLPEKFVLKGAHGYNFNLLVKDRESLNPTKARLLMHKWMTKNQYYRGGMEWAYKNVVPKLIAESYLENGTEGLHDYKFYCFDGVSKFLQVDIGRGDTYHARAFYDMNWNKLPFSKGRGRACDTAMERPKNFQEMVDVVSKLAEGFPFVRVDFYNLDGRIVFGEMTFYPGDGRHDFYPEEYNTLIGNYLNLPELNGGKYLVAHPAQA